MAFLRRFLAPVIALLAAAAFAAAQDKPNQAEAQQALASVPEILKQVSKLTNLPIKAPVQGEVVSREQIRGYITERMKESTTHEDMHAQEAALIKFGLLPAGFKLESFVLDLLSEQATAFYDPKSKKIYLSDWAPLNLQQPAIAHELTHALQDQHTSLTAFMEDKKMSQDEQAARQSVVEGEGVLAMMDYMMAPSGLKAADLPNLGSMVEDAAKSEDAKFPVFSAAPPYLKEGLLFPYMYGLTYAQAKQKAVGADKVYGELLDHPPHSTHEIMHPDAPAVAPPSIEAPEIPAAQRAGYKKLDSNVLGEFDVFTLLKITLSEDVAHAVAPLWRAFRYDVYENASGKVLLAHRSQWKDANSAAAFAEAYRRVIAKKAFAGEETRIETHGETVDVIEGLPPAPRK